MRRAYLRLTATVAALFALVAAGAVTSLAHDSAGRQKAAREKAAREAAVAYAKAYNAAVALAGLQKKGSVDDVLKVAAVPFFPGQVTNLQGSGPPTWISPVIFKKDDEVRKHLAPRLGFPHRPTSLPVEFRGVESYADYRKKYLEKEPDTKGDIRRSFVRKALREGCDAVVNARDGLIVYLVDKSGTTTGFLIRFDKDQGKVVGVLSEPYAEPGAFGVPKPARER